MERGAEVMTTTNHGMTYGDLERLSLIVRFTDWVGTPNHEFDVSELGAKVAQHIHYENRDNGRIIVGLGRMRKEEQK